MWRSLLAVCLLALAGAFSVTGAASATAPQGDHVVVAAQPTETPTPTGTGPELDPPQQDNAEAEPSARQKMWLGGTALVLFALVFWRNKRKWAKWRAGKG
ncbi:hypothetical protein [Saccharothrix coeruleofusca]|uniref:MYXO-CTERM domain-containing protein n=1 Tax=Saccharothrix coeruleofusca TaxID=33919 RepID=A0A918EF56_9PSEU|nr:hypothetical protein [Saccharothrix coeruleofusca]MBP2339176.1 hypothetical protein [Saccharothrix coeruleofusca]GGP70462.1 hypothetical protein GCM10010185_49420 [Saccharothrix coeruleofusca]